MISLNPFFPIISRFILPSFPLKVIDWGLAGSFEQGRMKSSVGTSTYSAPEARNTTNGAAWELGFVPLFIGKFP